MFLKYGLRILKRKNHSISKPIFNEKEIFKSHKYLNFDDPSRMAKAYYLFPNFDKCFIPSITPYKGKYYKTCNKLKGTIEFQTKYYKPYDIIGFAFCIHEW